MKLITVATLFCFLLTGCNEKKAKRIPHPQPQPEVESTPTPAPQVDPVTVEEPPVDPVVTEPVKIDLEASIEGQYLAVFTTLNPKITQKLTGAFTFSRDTVLDEVVGDVRLTNAGPALLHAQYVRVGKKCPTMQDDTNLDGIIDVIEAEAVYGKVLFPLDGDLTTQAARDTYFPVGDVYGNYYYSEVAKFSEFIKDLRAESTDGYFKLKENEGLDIEGRAVVVHGVPEDTELPETVRTNRRLTNRQTLPIVCGIVKKVVKVPGSIETGARN